MMMSRRLPSAAVVLLFTAASATGLSGCRRSVEVRGNQTSTIDPSVEKPPYLNWPREPVFEKIPGTKLTCMASYDGKPIGPDYYICRSGRAWFWFYRGHWFTAREWKGPWKSASRVPGDFLSIPAGDAHRALAEAHPEFQK